MYIRTDEIKKKNSISNLGKHYSPETEFQRNQFGDKNPMYGKHHSEKTKEKQRTANLGKHPSEETKKKMSENHYDNSGIHNPRFGKGPTPGSFKKGDRVGGDNSNYRGGITSLNKQIRNSDIYKEWEHWVKDWDDYTCQHCGKHGGKLESHHIKQFADIMKENKITAIEQAEACESLWDVSNGITYCKSCHDLLSWKGGLL